MRATPSLKMLYALHSGEPSGPWTDGLMGLRHSRHKRCSINSSICFEVVCRGAECHVRQVGWTEGGRGSQVGICCQDGILERL